MYQKIILINRISLNNKNEVLVGRLDQQNRYTDKSNYIDDYPKAILVRPDLLDNKNKLLVS